MSNPTIAGKTFRPGAHGTRGRYVFGCRCRLCRRANFLRAQAQFRRGTEMALALPAEPPRPAEARTYTYPDGRVVTRVYRSGCPGVEGKPCPGKSYVRKDSPGGRCGRCRARLAWNGNVPTARALAHIARLSRAGIGSHQVADASGVARSIILDMKAGRKTHIRKSTQERILAVDAGARADRSLVSAKRTQALLRQLIEEGGFTRSRLARELGYQGANPVLRFRTAKIAARNALKVELLHRRYMEVA